MRVTRPAFPGALLGPIGRSLAASLVLATSAPALAQDDWDLDEDEKSDDSGDKDADEGARPADAPAPIDDFDPDDDDAWMDKPADEAGAGEDAFQLDEDVDAEVKPRGEGEDTASIYREYLEEVSRFGPDEEALAWERYLKKYPNSIFKARIDTRLEELSEAMYSSYLEDDSQRTVDGGKRELNFALPLLLDNIDPRSKLRAGFAWGIPDYLNLMVDAEYQIFRELSVHGGIKNQFDGFHFAGGAKYAIVKSARTNLLVTAMADVRFNFNPTYPALLPQLAVGKRFDFGDAHMDVMGIGGTDLAFIPSESEGSTVFDPRFLYGGHVTVAPSDTVVVFTEILSYSKPAGDDRLSGSFHFDQVTFGIRFIQRKTKTKEKFNVGGGASAPYGAKYWTEHEGSITADIHYFL